jgi:WD40 repeat protein
LAFSPNDDLLVVSKESSGKGADLQVWDTEKCVIKAVLKSHDARITCISFNPGGDMIASGDAKGKIIIWDAAHQKQIKMLPAHEGEVTSLCYSPNSDVLASIGGDAKVKVWKLKTWEQVSSYASNDAGRGCLCFTPDGDSLVFKGAEGLSVLIGEIKDPKVNASLEHDGIVSVESLSSDGKSLLIGTVGNFSRFKGMRGKMSFSETMRALSEPGELILWDLPSLERKFSIKVPRSGVVSATISPSGEFAVYCKYVDSVKSYYPLDPRKQAIEDKRSKVCAFYLVKTSSHQVFSVTCKDSPKIDQVLFSHNGKMLATAGEGKVEIWPIKDVLKNCEPVISFPFISIPW